MDLLKHYVNDMVDNPFVLAKVGTGVYAYGLKFLQDTSTKLPVPEWTILAPLMCTKRLIFGFVRNGHPVSAARSRAQDCSR